MVREEIMGALKMKSGNIDGIVLEILKRGEALVYSADVWKLVL